MALDVYVGSLTRYYAGDWESVGDRTAREAGKQSGSARRAPVGDAEGPRAHPGGGARLARDARPSRSAPHLAEPLDWSEDAEAPWFTGRPGWDGFGSLVLWAAYAEQPALRRPASLARGMGRRSRAGAQQRRRASARATPTSCAMSSCGCPALSTSPSRARMSTAGASSSARRRRSRRQLGELNAATWKTDAEIVAALAARRAGRRRTARAARAPRDAVMLDLAQRVGRAQPADEARLLTCKTPPAGRGRGGEPAVLSRRECGAGGSVAGGRLRRSFMNWSNSARSLAERSRSRKSRNSRCSSSSLRSVSSRYSSKATLPCAGRPSDGGASRRAIPRASRGGRGAASGPVPAAVAAMLPAKHASTPFQVDQKGEAHRPEHDEARRPPGRSRRASGCRPVFPSGPSWTGLPRCSVNDVNVNDIYIGHSGPGSQGRPHFQAFGENPVPAGR